MAFSLFISDTVRFRVRGALNDERGAEQPFDFWLEAERLPDTEAVQSYLQAMAACESKAPITETMLPKMRGWSGVTEKPGGADVPFSEPSFRALMAKPGMAFLVHNTYLREVGAKEKN